MDSRPALSAAATITPNKFFWYSRETLGNP
jgi:hypothetical protein